MVQLYILPITKMYTVSTIIISKLFKDLLLQNHIFMLKISSQEHI